MLDISWISENPQLTIIMALIILLIISNLVIFWRLRSTRRLLHTYEKLFKDYDGTTVDVILQHVSEQQKTSQADVEALRQQVVDLEKRLPQFINRLAIQRFKGFPDVGGDMSFSLALLSDIGDGVLLTGLYGREETRVYAKPIQGFSSSYQLSREEEEVLLTAQKM